MKQVNTEKPKDNKDSKNKKSNPTKYWKGSEINAFTFETFRKSLL